jgi:hypothetical protein
LPALFLLGTPLLFLLALLLLLLSPNTRLPFGFRAL